MKKGKHRYEKEGNLIKPEKFKQSVSKSDFIVGLSCHPSDEEIILACKKYRCGYEH